MLRIPDSGYILRLMGIDNGSTTLGSVIGDLDLRQRILTIQYAHTCNAERMLHRYGQYTHGHSPRFARYQALRDFLTQTLEDFSPDQVAIESPFLMRRNPEAFAVLRELMLLLQDTIAEYSPLLPFETVTPYEAKRAINARSFTDGKEPIREAVLALPDVRYGPGIDPLYLDEHCIDAIAVLYHVMQQLIGGRVPHETRRRR